MDILVTGGAGFIGSHLTDYLLQEGHSVDCVDNLRLGRIGNVSHQLKNGNFKFHKFDVLDFKKLDNLFRQRSFDVVYHLVANSDIKQSSIDTKVDVELNFMSTYNTLEAMRRNKVRQIVFASTSAIFGERDRVITENTGPIVPISFYGASKAAAEAYISAYVHNFGITAWIIRFPNVVGERATHGILFDLMHKLKKNKKILAVLGDGSQEKSYLYVKELVDGMVYVWRKAKDDYNCFNVGGNSTIKVSRIVQILLEELNLSGKTRVKYAEGDRGWVGDVPRFRYSVVKIDSLGWRARLNSEQAVRLAVRNLKKEFGF